MLQLVRRNTEILGLVSPITAKILIYYTAHRLNSRDHASGNQVESAQEGDALLCRDAGDRMVPLYPGRRLPGAEEAEKSCVGRRVGDKFVCRLGDREVSLRVEEILRLESHPVDDELIRDSIAGSLCSAC